MAVSSVALRRRSPRTHFLSTAQRDLHRRWLHSCNGAGAGAASPPAHPTRRRLPGSALPLGCGPAGADRWPLLLSLPESRLPPSAITDLPGLSAVHGGECL